ncbi:DNA-binding HxlR family transcriptional regulator [Saccharopolyspora lacisalsi]|uniref:DNA-binding HxlR family transcriptional regulator n=1 Tax=Halosaccharopolyspora lacisalsi TaxID=1000566 RepID=A0A839DZY9_9PSEU|nr:helix-turn-helix domain-containing protein [Halosaccharopolyspora lacisalsi]MBA8824985.1 DNA-binding HxlR family transcriptional regulator [Halosaccharopolyspora lacisalsi]
MTTGAAKRRERNYRQYCGLAAALDAVGERWTLLIVRECMLGPRRYNELLTDLPGIGTNLLADRLKKLCTLGVLRHRGSAERGYVYELTEAGESLREPVKGLARWGMALVDEVPEDAVVRPHWGFLAIESMADATRCPNVREEYEFRVDDEVFHLLVDHGTTTAARGAARGPALVATTDAATFVRIGSGTCTPFDAVGEGKLALSGDPEAVLRCSTVLGLGAVGAPD